MTKQSRIISASISIVGLVVMFAAGIMAWPRLEEEWWLYKLNSEDKEEGCRAAERLGRLGSSKAVPVLIDGMRRAIAVTIAGQDKYIGPPERLMGNDGQVYYRALARIGKPALPGLIRYLADAE